MGVKLYPQVGTQCWRYALAHLLRLEPKQVPNFVKNDRPDFVIKTRKWLNKFGKTILFVDVNEFCEENLAIRYNTKHYPQGDCIACVETTVNGKTDYHAFLLRDGHQLEHPKSKSKVKDVIGYFIVYDLCQSKSRLK
jgi:hypothetical protein